MDIVAGFSFPTSSGAPSTHHWAARGRRTVRLHRGRRKKKSVSSSATDDALLHFRMQLCGTGPARLLLDSSINDSCSLDEVLRVVGISTTLPRTGGAEIVNHDPCPLD
ncbi:hypothetical protein GQ600_12560 [Phytophthora cactorum]|nr:hypothetical protein GQ600_12560 [Phytophthora cactorum]